MKYELTDETIEVKGRTLYRIRYLKTGETGGWVESERNLSQEGDAAVYGYARVFGNAAVFGNAEVCDNAEVSGNAQVYGDAQIYGYARASGYAQVFDYAWVFDDAKVSGNARVYGDASARGDAEVSGNARVCGGTWHASPLQIQGTKFFFSVSSKSTITVGCTTGTVAEWVSSYEHMFKAHGFTEMQQREYKLYFNLAAQLYGWDARLPVLEDAI